MVLTDAKIGDILLVKTAGQWSTLATITEMSRSIVTAPPHRFDRRTGRELTDQRMATRWAMLATEADIFEVETQEAKHACIRKLKALVHGCGTLMHLTTDELSAALVILSRPNPILVEGYAPNAKVC